MARVASDKVQARAEAQRERILEAAYSCFVEMGFHAAGMAAISARADMSPGLIYRYFPEGKAAIIQGIIEDQLERTEEEIRSVQKFDLANDLMAGLDRPSDDRRRMSPSLMLELSAIASRDEQIAAVVKRFDVRLRDAIAESLVRTSSVDDGVPMASQDAAVWALMVQLVFEGMRVRQAREPDIDRDLMRMAVEQLFRANVLPTAPAK